MFCELIKRKTNSSNNSGHAAVCQRKGVTAAHKHKIRWLYNILVREQHLPGQLYFMAAYQFFGIFMNSIRQLV